MPLASCTGTCLLVARFGGGSSKHDLSPHLEKDDGCSDSSVEALHLVVGRHVNPASPTVDSQLVRLSAQTLRFATDNQNAGPSRRVCHCGVLVARQDDLPTGFELRGIPVGPVHPQFLAITGLHHKADIFLVLRILVRK
uniref:Uncharacterized protein n=1 Tax=Ixodes ricinus TaxID=34613 RepID=A0A6B0USW5_IXORI